MKLNLISSLVLVSGALAQRTLTVYNKRPFVIWPAMYTGKGASSDYPTGMDSFSVCVCDVPGPKRLDCWKNLGRTVPPASLAEFTSSHYRQQRSYDVSLVDGYNLPLAITNNVGCSIADYPVDLNPHCPSSLEGPIDSSGFPIGCRSACQANLDGNPSNSPNCCTGQYSTPATCPPSGVEYYSYFKDNCPNSYCYPYDGVNGTALRSCPSNRNAEYTITFCP